MIRPGIGWCVMAAAAHLVAFRGHAQAPLDKLGTGPPSTSRKPPPLEIVLIESGAVTPAAVAKWKSEGFKGVAVILDERIAQAESHAQIRQIPEAGLDLYWWIEVARNPALAEAHPRWMAALGMHKDWRRDFPKIPEPPAGTVAKAFPWVPIGYREAFDAHLGRIERLLRQAPPGWRGVLLNDLQAGPSSCGCGNLQCRWALDYHVTSTADKTPGPSVAGRFVTEVRKRAGGRLVIPVWTTECEEVDLPADKQQGRTGTQLCGTIGCAVGLCPEEFSRQWTGFTAVYDGPIGLLSLHRAFQRSAVEFGGGPGWVTNAIGYLNRTLRQAQDRPLPKQQGKSILPQQLWVVVEGLAAEEATARGIARQADVAAVIVARTRIDQSYEPRMVPAP